MRPDSCGSRQLRCYPQRVSSRTFRSILLAAGLVLASLLACRPAAPVFEAEYHVFGTQVQVSLAIHDDALAHQAFTELQQLFQNLHQSLHAWEPSELTRLNQAIAAGQSFAASPELIGLIHTSQWLEQATGGRFNPAVGALVSAWGFHTSDYPVTSPPPDKAFLSAWSGSVPSTRSLTIDQGQVSSRDPRVQLDFGAIAKGHAVDRAIELLQGLGIDHAMVNAGGDLRAMGQRHHRPWRVAVQNPVDGDLVTVINLDDGRAVFTSGGQYRYRQTGPGEPRWPHVLNPETGLPATASAAVTVVAESGVVADAWATALFVATRDGDPQLAGLHRVIRIDSDGIVHDSARSSGATDE